MNIRLYSERDRTLWNKYVMKSNDSNCYQLIEWKDVIERSFGHKTYYLLAEDREEEIKGILPLVQLKSFLFGKFMVSLPYFNYGGICSDSEEVLDLLLNEGIRIATEGNVEHMELRHTASLGDRLSVKTAKVSMRLGFPGKQDDLWDSFSSNLRRKIRRATKEGLYAKFGREEELANFYNVFSINMRDLGTPVYSKEFFKNILKEFPESTWICTVKTDDEKPVAAGFLIGFKEVLEIPWVSSVKKYNRYYPNLLLYWSVINFACEAGYKIFDLGRSTPGEGTYKFKEQWGARPVQLYWHYWLKNIGPLPEINPKNARYQLPIKVWRKLPVGLTRIIGPMIVKNIP